MIIAVVAAVVVAVLAVAWLSDRRDAQGGKGRLRAPGSIAADATRGRQAAKWKGRSYANRGLTPMDTGDERRD